MVRVVLVVLVVGVGDAAAADKVFRAQLDGDAALEQVRTESTRASQWCQGYACTRLVIRDGRRRAALTPFRQTPRFPYGWRVGEVRLADFDGDGRREVFWFLNTAGGTGSSPRAVGVSSWDGRRATRRFRFDDGGDQDGLRPILFTGKLDRSTGGLPEIVTREGMYDEDDGTCCPSKLRDIRFRWDGTRIAEVPGSRRLTET